MPVWHSHSIGWRVRSLVSSPYNASIFIVELPTYNHAYIRIYTLGYSAMWIYEWISRIASHALRERKQVRPAGRQANTIGSWVYCLHISCVFFLFFFLFYFHTKYGICCCCMPAAHKATRIYYIIRILVVGFHWFFSCFCCCFYRRRIAAVTDVVVACASAASVRATAHT